MSQKQLLSKVLSYSPKVELLGNIISDHCQFLFLRSADRESVMVLRPGKPNSRVFLKSPNAHIEYRLWPRDIEPGPLRQWLERLGTDILKAFEAGRQQKPPVVTTVKLESASVETVKVAVPLPSGLQAVVETAADGRFDHKVCGCSASVSPDLASFQPEERGVVQYVILEQIARLVFCTSEHRHSQPPAARATEPAKAVDSRTVYVDLGSMGTSQETTASVKNHGGLVTLALDVPSVCCQNCQFCLAKQHWEYGQSVPLPNSVHSAATAHKGQSLVTVLDAHLAALDPVFATSATVDVSINGMDALQHDQLPDLISHVRSHGRFRRISVITPGTGLVQDGMARRLAAAGLDSVTMTLLGPDAHTHDAIAGRPGAFDDLIRSIGAVQEVGMDCWLNVVVVRDNLEMIGPMVERVMSWQVRATLYAFTPEPGTPAEMLEKCQFMHSDFAVRLSGIRQQIEVLAPGIKGFAFCTLPPWARSLAVGSTPKASDSPRLLPNQCGNCSVYGVSCGSVTESYLEAYGSDELKPING